MNAQVTPLTIGQVSFEWFWEYITTNFKQMTSNSSLCVYKGNVSILSGDEFGENCIDLSELYYGTFFCNDKEAAREVFEHKIKSQLVYMLDYY